MPDLSRHGDGPIRTDGADEPTVSCRPAGPGPLTGVPDRPILLWPDIRLSTRCDPAGPPDDSLRSLAAEMLRVMYAAPGRGLAAPQIGVLRQMFVMDVAWRDGPPAPEVFLDPVIDWTSDEVVTMDEACLSIPGIVTPIIRPARLRLTWTDLDGTARDGELEGARARCALHEIDHLHGIVTLDRLPPEIGAEARAAYAARSAATLPAGSGPR